MMEMLLEDGEMNYGWIENEMTKFQNDTWICL